MGRSGKRSRGKSGARRGGGNRVNPSAATLTYTGPATLAASYNAAQLILVRLTTISNISTDSSGVLSATGTNSPASDQDWSNYAALYYEYRVLATRVHWIPRDVGFSTTVTPSLQGPLIAYVLRVTTGPPVPLTINAAFDNDGAQARNIGKEWSKTIKMSGAEDAAFKQTASPSFTNAVCLYSSGLSVSQLYGALTVEHLIQFRARV